jgi:uncharacterized protein (TIGR03118 family)
VGELLTVPRRRALFALALMFGLAAIAVAPLRAAEHTSFTVVPLVSDQPGVAPNTDPNLVNAWGLTSGPSTPWWISDNGTDKSTLYRGDGQPQALVVSVPNAPTGTVFNPTTAFQLPTGGKALFLFDTEEGKVLGWNGAQGTTAVVVANLDDGAIYKGLALGTTSSGPRLYATDFHNRRVDVFDGSFTYLPDAGFVDPSIPDNYGPFGIQTIGNRVFVTYAQQDADGEDDVAGQGKGFVDVFDTAGSLLGRVAQHGQLNSPWGLVVAPPTFGRFAGDLLVGNFGDGQINAYAELGNGRFEHRGELRDSSNRPLTIDGLWALQLAQGGNNGVPGTLYFTAGPDDEQHGLFGKIMGG